MKLQRTNYTEDVDGRPSSAGAWRSTDGLWLFAVAVGGGWLICPLSYPGNDDSERDHLIKSLGIDCHFPTRREAIAALELALQQRPLSSV